MDDNWKCRKMMSKIRVQKKNLQRLIVDSVLICTFETVAIKSVVPLLFDRCCFSRFTPEWSVSYGGKILTVVQRTFLMTNWLDHAGDINVLNTLTTLSTSLHEGRVLITS